MPGKTKLTEAEIRKALECCISKHYDVYEQSPCLKCPLNRMFCLGDLLAYSLDLINRINAENKEMDAEIKRLQDENLLLSQKRVNMFERLEFVKRAGDKAIEEFVKEHKKIMRTFLDDDNEFLMKWCEYEANTDNLANRLKNGEASNG